MVPSAVSGQCVLPGVRAAFHRASVYGGYPRNGPRRAGPPSPQTRLPSVNADSSQAKVASLQHLFADDIGRLGSGRPFCSPPITSQALHA